MSGLDAIKAQPMALKTLRSAVAQEQLASSYLFEGPSGVGKEMAAVALAVELVARGNAQIKKRIADDNHPDVRIFRPREEGKRNIKVEQLRAEILPLAQFAPFEASASFFIFPQADVSFPEIQPESANALLKTLEEPKRGVHFILVAERADRLLPTIRSRCQRVRFHALPQEVLEDILRAHDIADDAIGPAVALAGGRADRAIELATDGTAGELLTLALEVDDVVRSNRPGRITSTAERLSQHPASDLALETLRLFYRDLAAARLGVADAQLAFRHHAADLRERARRVSVQGATARFSRIAEHQLALEQNANRHVAMDALLFELRALR